MQKRHCRSGKFLTLLHSAMREDRRSRLPFPRLKETPVVVYWEVNVLLTITAVATVLVGVHAAGTEVAVIRLV
jgi:hypothetical protein